MNLVQSVGREGKPKSHAHSFFSLPPPVYTKFSVLPSLRIQRQTERKKERKKEQNKKQALISLFTFYLHFELSFFDSLIIIFFF